MNNKALRGLAGSIALVLGALACRPVIAIGWEEFLFLFIVIAVLIGPPVHRFIRRIENHQKHKEKDK